MTDDPLDPMADRARPRRRRITDDQSLLAGSRQPENFTQSDPWRVLRITGEFVEGFDALADLGPAVTIFGSARTGPAEADYRHASELARQLGEQGFSIITGGGPGIMEAANQGAHEAGVLSVGLNIELPFEQHVNPYVDLSVDFRYFFVRKMMLVKYAQAFVIFPGGFGTMDELFESLTLIQTGKIENFPVVLFGADYWGGLRKWLLETMVPAGKISEADADLLVVTDSVEEACSHIVECGVDGSHWKRREEMARRVTEAVFGRR